MSSETSCLICVGVGRSDGRHKADSSLHAITKVPRIFDNSTVLMMGIKCGGVLFVLVTQLLNGNARGCNPRHQGN